MNESQPKKLSFPALTAMVVGSMVGAGIFMLPRRFATETGVYGALIAWAIAGIGMLMLAFVFQALALRKPDLNAGVFAYAKAGFGDYMGFIAATGFWASACAGNVTYLVLIKSTLGALWPALGEGDTVIALVLSSVLIWLYFLLISRGTQQAAVINAIATVAKIIPIILFIVLAIFFFDGSVFMQNMSGAASAGGTSLIEQVKATMMITVFVFLGIEGASVYSRYAKTRKDVGRATVTGFLSVLALLISVTILSYGILPQAEIAALRQPSLAGVLEAAVGPWGSVFISAGIIISVLGAYLAWSLMSAEVFYAAAEGGDAPKFIRQKNSAGAPQNALILSSLLTQVILIATYFSEGALDFALDLTSSLALLPFFLTAAYAAKIALSKDGYAGISESTRKKEIVVGIITILYTLFLLIAAGLKLLLFACLLLAPATALFYIARKEQNLKTFTKVELGLFVLLALGAVACIVGLATGYLTI